MKKIVILGCENSHATLFLEFIKNNAKFRDLEVIGVYSDDTAAAEKLNETFGVYVMKRYDEFVGQVDGVMNTARHGDNHYKFLEPYLKYPIAVFVDKPITIKEQDALNLISDANKYGVKLTGGSCLRHDGFVQEIKRDVLNEVDGKTHSGVVRAPVKMDNPYGGFFFYVQHLVEIALEAFGRYPIAVTTHPKGTDITIVFEYENYNIIGLAGIGVPIYHICRYSNNNAKSFTFNVEYDRPCFFAEFNEFFDMLYNAESTINKEDLIAPVFVMNAIKNSLDSGERVLVKRTV